MAHVSYRFGEFVLDGDTRQLLRGTQEIHLSSKAFELLSILIAKRPRLVSKAELQEKLWPSTFVEETNLAGLAAEIRRALDDSATSPKFVRTVYRFGYRFTGEVVEAGTATPASAAGRPRLVFQNHDAVLMEGANVIGRAPDATIQCEGTGVSRHHARIVLANGQATLEDLGSKNGTFLNDKRITAAPLSDQDEIQIGTASLTFRLDAPLGSTETVATDTRSKRSPRRPKP